MTVLTALGIIIGIGAAAFIVLAVYASLTVASYWDDIEEDNDEQ